MFLQSNSDASAGSIVGLHAYACRGKAGFRPDVDCTLEIKQELMSRDGHADQVKLVETSSDEEIMLGHLPAPITPKLFQALGLDGVRVVLHFDWGCFSLRGWDCVIEFFHADENVRSELNNVLQAIDGSPEYASILFAVLLGKVKTECSFHSFLFAFDLFSFRGLAWETRQSPCAATF